VNVEDRNDVATTRNPLAFCSIAALDRPLARVAELAAALGLDGIEVTARPPHLELAADLVAVRDAGRTVRAAGSEVVAYGSYLGRFRLTTADSATREAARAAALGAPLLRVWAEPLGAAPDDRATVVALLRAACDAAQAEGITVVIERHVGSFADTPERIAALLDAIDRPNVALNYQVLDFLPPEAAPLQPADATALIPHARYFHLKNYRPNDTAGGPLLLGAALADGVLDYRAILAAALDAGYAGPLTVEFLAADARSVEDKLAADVAFVRALLAERGARA
jgi:sugar phosphate isomerase/epimerase